MTWQPGRHIPRWEVTKEGVYRRNAFAYDDVYEPACYHAALPCGLEGRCLPNFDDANRDLEFWRDLYGWLQTREWGPPTGRKNAA